MAAVAYGCAGRFKTEPMIFRHLLSRLGHSTGSGEVMPGIDGLRAIAVSLVVLFHIYAFGSASPQLSWFGVDPRPWLATGFVGVYLFLS